MRHFFSSLLFASLIHGAAYAQSGAGSAEVLNDPARMAEIAKEEAARGNHSSALAFYVRAIARTPNDVTLLAGAGNEALAIGDTDAAFGFLARAVTLAPRDGPIRASYGTALIQAGRAKDALTLFDQATSLGVAEARIASDRGLARDLLGDSRRAQKDYRLALAAAPGDPAATERLALSLAISGDREAALALVQPLARRMPSGNAARTLAFVHALTGDVATAHRIATANISAAQADELTPFLARLSLLTPAEKATAVHLGRLPAVRYVQDSERAIPSRVSRADGDPSAVRAMALGDRPPLITAADGAPILPPAPEVKRKDNPEKPLIAMATVKPEPKAKLAPDTKLAETKPGKTPSKTEAGADVNRKGAVEPTDKGEESAKASRLSPSDDCAGLEGKKRVQCQADARALEKRCGGPDPRKTAECSAYTARMAVREEPAEQTKGKAKTADKRAKKEVEATSSRRSEQIWVQVAGGANRKDMPKAWSKVKGKTALLAKRKPYVAAAGATNRLVVGPFDDAAEARAFINKLAAEDVSSFPWTSGKGDKVERLELK